MSVAFRSVASAARTSTRVFAEKKTSPSSRERNHTSRDVASFLARTARAGDSRRGVDARREGGRDPARSRTHHQGQNQRGGERRVPQTGLVRRARGESRHERAVRRREPAAAHHEASLESPGDGPIAERLEDLRHDHGDHRRDEPDVVPDGGRFGADGGRHLRDGPERCGGGMRSPAGRWTEKPPYYARRYDRTPVKKRVFFTYNRNHLSREHRAPRETTTTTRANAGRDVSPL